jgi:type II secretory pathway pseudopilin PulG
MPGRRTAPRQGLVLLALLILLALAGLGALVGLDIWAISRQQAREQELLFIGKQYTDAVAHYYFSAPNGQPKTLPGSLADLLTDNRYAVPVRHLRRVYLDPMTGQADWAFERVGCGVEVHSLSQAVPLKQAGFAPSLAHLTGQQAYSAWRFRFMPPLLGCQAKAPVPQAPQVIDPAHRARPPGSKTPPGTPGLPPAPPLPR